MINLLPPEIKAGYHYARRNVQLRRWVVMSLIALIGLMAVGTFGLVTLHQSTTGYSNQVVGAEAQLQKDNLKQTTQQVQDISNSLRLAVQVLSKEVLFSKLITQIGAVMPNGAVLSELNINTEDTGLDLDADTTNYNTATQVQVNLSAPSNKIFAKVDIVNITCSNVQAVNPQYPCVAQFRALFNTKNPFLFINQGGSS
jgi:hypothetical protein